MKISFFTLFWVLAVLSAVVGFVWLFGGYGLMFVGVVVSTLFCGSCDPETDPDE